MRVEFLEPARAELQEAIAYYDSQRQGLGSEFGAEVKGTIKKSFLFPGGCPSLSKGPRRCRTRRFPYGIIYQVKSDFVLIVAVMHLHREPGTWRDRLPRENQ